MRSASSSVSSGKTVVTLRLAIASAGSSGRPSASARLRSVFVMIPATAPRSSSISVTDSGSELLWRMISAAGVSGATHSVTGDIASATRIVCISETGASSSSTCTPARSSLKV